MHSGGFGVPGHQALQHPTAPCAWPGAMRHAPNHIQNVPRKVSLNCVAPAPGVALGSQRGHEMSGMDQSLLPQTPLPSHALQCNLSSRWCTTFSMRRGSSFFLLAQTKMSWRSLLLEVIPRDQGSELSNATMIPQMTVVAGLTLSTCEPVLYSCTDRHLSTCGPVLFFFVGSDQDELA